jgi:predicted phage terminase large subunit-like protein
VIIIDDPIKNAREADSKLERERLWDWYTRTLRNRLEPGGKMIVVMARWHEDDLVGRLFDPSYVSDKADRWERIHLPAVAEPAPWELDDQGQLLDGRSLDEWTDPVGRRRGEPLWPERYSRRRLKVLEASVGPRGWTSNFQQRPTATTSGMFSKSKWRFAEALPADIMLLRYWDLAASVTGDWVAGVLLGIDKRGIVYVVDVARMRGEPDDVEMFIGNIADGDAAEYGKGVVHHVVEQEPGSGGKFQAGAYIKGPLANHSAEMKGAGGSKVVMAGPFAGQVGAGNVYVLLQRRSDGEMGRPEWYPDFADEAAEFPNGPHDDQIDSATKAYVHLRERFDKKKKQRVTGTSVAARSLQTSNRSPGRPR